jgi:APA family basic amino acid/polyamine antiporter
MSMDTKPSNGPAERIPEAPGDAGFIRALGLFSATMLVAGSMIGSGVFIVSADIARSVGSPFWLLAIWAVSGLMTVIGALSYGELAGMMPRAGGQYVYLREAFGPTVAFLYGWTFFLIIGTGTIAAVAVAFGKFLGVFFDSLAESTIVLRTGLAKGWPFAEINSAQLVGVGLIVLLTAVNLRGIRTGKVVQNIFTTAKVASLLGIVGIGAVAGLTLGGTGNLGTGFFDRIPIPQEEAALPFLVVLGAAMVGALFSSDAWNNITFAAAEVRDPRRNLPRSLFLGTGLVTLLYIGANIAYLLVLDFGSIADAPEKRVATLALGKALGSAGAGAMAAAILVSTFGCNNGLILAGARVTYAMARDGLFFPGAGELNRAGVPGKALLWQGAVASVLTLSGTYGKLLDFVIFATLVFYIATVLAIPILRRKRPDIPRPYRAAGYPFLPALYILLAAGVAAALLLHPKTRGSSLIGLGIVAAGAPVYAVLRGRLRRTATDDSGEPT